MPNQKIQSLTVQGVTYDIVDNTSGYITGITSSDVTGALGFTPYNSTNPNGYTTNTGTITSVKTTAGAHTTINVTSGAANFNVPTNTSHLTNDSGFLTSYTETDPIFVASAAHGITSTDITNWNNKLDSYTETDPTVPAWAKASTKPSYTFSEIGSTPSTLSGYGITNAYTKTEVDGLVSGVLHYKGTKASVANLPTTGNVTGDVWHITADGSEYAWDGSIWQELGTAVDLSGYALSSEIPTTAQNATTGITIADHSTTTIYGVTSSTTSVRGVKTGTNSTTTASKASGANGTAPTLGTPISIWGVKSGTNSTTTASKVTVGSHSTDYGVKSAGSGSYTQGSFSGGSFTQGTDSFTANTPTVIDTTKFSGGSYSHTGFNGGSGSFTQGTFTGGSLVVTSHVLSFTPATHGADSHTHTPATYGTDSFTAASLGTGFYTAGTAASFTQGEDTFTPATHGADSHTHTAPTLGSKVPTVSASDVTVPIRMDEATSVPNVTDAGSASTWSFTDVTVPIRADADTTVPVKDSGTTVVTSKTHSITDNGHTHTLD